MALLEIRADLSKVARQLERIADLLEEIVHPPIPQIEPSTEEDLGNYGLDVKEAKTVWDAYDTRRRNY